MSTNLRILALHNANHEDQDKRSAVDSWRIKRPMRELRKLMPDWTITERSSVIPDLPKYKDRTEFTEAELEKAYKDICSYDIVFSAYQSNPTIYTLLQVARKNAHTQYVMDVDDDMFAINRDNPVWQKITDDNVDIMQRMIRDNPWINTTTPELAQVFRERRGQYDPDTVFITPNFIPDDYKHPAFDNGDKIVIGFFGGSSHYGDMHRTGVLDAIEKLMHEHKNVYFKSVGMIIDRYIPKSRLIVGDGKRGDPWLHEIFPNLNMDIAIAPLEDNIFNRGKSNIKWQEATRAGAAVVASRIGPYKDLSPRVARTVFNTPESWYTALRQLVEDTEYRQKIVTAAQAELKANWRLEDHAIMYRDMFEAVAVKQYATI